MLEHETRLVPIEAREVAYARNRPTHERPPIPKPGDKVWYRHNEWDQHVWPATILEVQDVDDRTDPHLWHLVRDTSGVPILDADIPRQVQVADPWPWVLLRVDDDRFPSPQIRTQEGRVRGSAGWLPLNYLDRPVRLPHELVMQPLEPLNVPLPRG